MMLSPSKPSCLSSLATAITITFLFLLGNCTEGFSPPTANTIAPIAHAFGTNVMGSAASTKLFVGSGIDPEQDMRAVIDEKNGNGTHEEKEASPMAPRIDAAPLSTLWATLTGGGPPLDVDDTQLLLSDVFLLVNLPVSISFLVLHRMDFSYVPIGLNEGALLSMCWIVAGLANGAFLSSAVNGHYDPTGPDHAEKGGPKAAGLLAVSTFVGTSSLRIMIALATAVFDHRPVGLGGEEFIPSEIAFGLVFMSAWRFTHSENTWRI